MNQPTPTGNNNNIMSLLSYLLAPLVGAIVLLTDMKNDPALKAHAVQGTALGVVMFVLSFLLTLTGIGACLAIFAWIPGLIYGIMAYQGKPVNIPVISDFCKKQGWM